MRKREESKGRRPTIQRPKVAQITDPATGVVVEETYRLDGRLHRDEFEGPAIIRRDAASGLIVAMQYWSHGLRHRSTGPASIQRIVSGRTERHIETYYRHGVLHRDPSQGPAMVVWFDGSVFEACYVVNGVDYRNPAEGPYGWGRWWKPAFTPAGTARPSPPALRARRLAARRALTPTLALSVGVAAVLALAA